MRFGLALCRDEQDAREVLQDTLLTATRSLGSFQGKSSLSTWLYAIARSFCIKHRTRGHAAVAVSSLEAAGADPALIETERTPEQQASVRELGGALAQAIAALEPAEREVLVLRDVEGLKAVEVAEVLGITVAAVKSRLHRARARVRERLAPLHGPEPPSGPSCPDVVERMSRMVEGELEPGVCRLLEAHVAECPACAARCDALKTVLRLCGSVPAPRVPAEIERALQDRLREALRGLQPDRD